MSPTEEPEPSYLVVRVVGSTTSERNHALSRVRRAVHDVAAERGLIVSDVPVRPDVPAWGDTRTHKNALAHARTEVEHLGRILDRRIELARAVARRQEDQT